MLDGAFRLAEAAFGRPAMWRLGRRIYFEARGEANNDIARNGEARLQRLLAQRAATENRALRVIDIGANRGQWASAMVDAAWTAGVRELHLICYEPIPPIHAALAASLSELAAMTGYRLDARAEAVTSAVGTVQMGVESLDAGTHHLLPLGSAVPASAIEVPATTLDRLSEDLDGPADFVKVDCEGFDPLVLAGGMETFRAARIGLAQFEYNHRWLDSRHYLRDVFAMFAGTDFRIGKVCPGEIVLFEEWHPELERFVESNYVVVRPDIAQLLGCRTVRFDAANTYA